MVQESLNRKMSVSGTAEKEEDVDMSDFDEASLKAKDGWKSLKVIEVSLCFHPTSTYSALVLTFA